MTPRRLVLLLILLLTSALAQDKPPHPESPAQTAQLPATSSLFTPDQIRALIQKVTDNDLANDKKQKDYTYVRREEDHELDKHGDVKKTESKTYEVIMLYGSAVERQIAKNDKPLSAKDAAKEDAKIQKIIDKRKNESDKDREKRLRQEEKDREESRQWVREISDAYNFRFDGTQLLDGRETYVIDGEPRPGFKPHLKYANYLPKFRFRLWIDKADLQMAKLDAECIDTVSWGLFVARLHKGSRFVVEQIRINDEVWLPKQEDIKVDGRFALLKGFNISVDNTYRDYRKFHADAKILGMTDAPK